MIGVRRRLAVTDDAHGDAEQVVLVQLDEAIEGVELTAERGLDQGAILPDERPLDSTSDSALSKRDRGSFSTHRSIASASAVGASARSDLVGGNASVSCLTMICCVFSPVMTGRPVNANNATNPSE